ncbi:MAG: lytic transglycosylase domain-containing protein [Synergistaceae bacterium]|jgi:hypothetical protein|nr:lytic transglycosylase domain-containing protein [Synergistaceae bacterium]
MTEMKTSKATLFKTMTTFLATIIPFVVLPFFVVSEVITAPDVRQAVAPDAGSVLMKLAPDKVPSPAKIGYGYPVVTVMKEMGLSLEHFALWVSEHPGSAIKHIKYMPEPMQRDVASIALFIRKSNSKIDAKTAWREASALVHYSAKYGVPSALTTAVAEAESTFNPDAVSSKGASGVMQVMWNIHNALLKSNGIHASPGSNPLSDPEQSIAAGCLLLSRYMRAYGSIQKAMDRYYGVSSTAYRRKINVNIARLMTHHSKVFD